MKTTFLRYNMQVLNLFYAAKKRFEASLLYKKHQSLTNLAEMNVLFRMNILRKKTIHVALLILFFTSCKQQKETLETLTVDELFPLKVGKYITYRLDSLVFINAGKIAVTKKYQLRYAVEEQTKDNLNRPAWKIYTYLNDSAATGPWVVNGFLIVTPLEKQLEITENNLRVIRIKLPVKEGSAWKGNSFLPDRPYTAIYSTSIDENMDLWDFTFEGINETEKIGSLTLPDVTTITHIDESRNVPLTTDTVYASRELSYEKYAKNIGLVYREHVLWENQPRQRTSGVPPVVSYDPIKVGFGVKMWMIDKN